MFTLSTERRTHCIRCGTCCLKGGPVLHQEDKKIFRSGYAGHKHLVTLRMGEIAYNPLRDRLEPVPMELIKVTGKGDGWSCVFYNGKESCCSLYEHRFLECRLLKCWDPSDIIPVIYKDTIRRADIINPDDPIMEVIAMHEKECPHNKVNALVSALSDGKNRKGIFAELSGFIHADSSLRIHAFSELGLEQEFELFIFGRPLYRILADRGLPVRELQPQ
jgi:Fe-S-cluster containining protein